MDTADLRVLTKSGTIRSISYDELYYYASRCFGWDEDTFIEKILKAEIVSDQGEEWVADGVCIQTKMGVVVPAYLVEDSQVIMLESEGIMGESTIDNPIE